MATAKFTQKFEMDQAVQDLFPLFSAEGEKLWVPGWDYENIMGGNELHEDYAFLTTTQDYASTDFKAIWLVKEYDPDNHLVVFYKVEPMDKIAIVTVKCAGFGVRKTTVTVSYEYIGLSDKGNEFINNYTQTDYDGYIGEWQMLLEKYFENK